MQVRVIAHMSLGGTRGSSGDLNALSNSPVTPTTEKELGVCVASDENLTPMLQFLCHFYRQDYAHVA